MDLVSFQGTLIDRMNDNHERDVYVAVIEEETGVVKVKCIECKDFEVRYKYASHI